MSSPGKLCIQNSTNPPGLGLLHYLDGFPANFVSFLNGVSGGRVLDLELQFFPYTSQKLFTRCFCNFRLASCKGVHPKCSHTHCLLVCLEKKISASSKLNIFQRGKMGWGNTCLWWGWGRGSQTGNEKVGELKSLQLPASNGHTSLLPRLPGLQVCVAWSKSVPDD